MAEISAWDVAAAGNGFAAPDGFPEGMNYSDVNNAAREIMAVLARWHADTNGSLTTGGTSNAYTLTPNRTISSYTNGLSFKFRADRANTGAVTLNVGGVGASSVVHKGGTELVGGEIAANGNYSVTYNATLTKWVIESVPKAANAEVIAGANTTKFTTPAGIAALRFSSGELTITAGAVVSAAHGLTVAPTSLEAYIICKTAELGYSVGDVVKVDNIHDQVNDISYGGTLYANATTVFMQVGDGGLAVNRRVAPLGRQFPITPANWRIILRARV
ncbi:hypothetical protein [Zhongshania sp.]|uniref:hypothetical protein n=1 Tax=Zhongshania sp. TaxID=1971902 RepID=UPI003562C8DA